MVIPAGKILIMKAFTESEPNINVERLIKDIQEIIEIEPGNEYSLSLDELLPQEDNYLRLTWNDGIYFCAKEDGVAHDFDMSKYDLSTC